MSDAIFTFDVKLEVTVEDISEAIRDAGFDAYNLKDNVFDLMIERINEALELDMNMTYKIKEIKENFKEELKKNLKEIANDLKEKLEEDE